MSVVEAVANEASRAPAAVRDALLRYESALAVLERTTSPEDLPSAALATLFARDALASTLSGPAGITPGPLSQAAQLDSRLRAQATRVSTSVGRGTLGSWRTVLDVRPNAWWWSLDTVADGSIPAPHPLWAIVAAAFITLAISLATDISLRFLSGGADVLGLFSAFSQALLALLAGGAFTRVGGEWIERLLGRRGVRKKSQGALKAALALAVLAVIVGLRLSLPAIARLYNDSGVEQQQAGRLTEARKSFERAVRLSPDYPQAHYNLASALEETLDYDPALGSYQRAIKLDERIYPAYNNLARLYILRRNDSASALALLNTAIELAPQDSPVQYSLYKNRGWANFGLKFHLQAEADLRHAIALRKAGGAAAHCLLAQVLEAQAREAAAEWESCVSYIEGERHEVEPGWLGLAQERLLKASQ